MVMVTTAVVFFLVVMVVLCFHLRQFSRNAGSALHSLHDLCAGQVIPGCCDNGGVCIVLSEHGNRSIQLFLRDAIGAGQDDGPGGFDLIIIELAKVLHIDLDLTCIHHRYSAIQHNILVCDLFHCGDHIGKLTYAGGLNQNAVGVILGDDLLQRLAKVTHQAAADTAGVHLGDVNAGILQEAAIDADLAEFVFDKNKLFSCITLVNHFLDEGCFSGAKEAGVNIDLCHCFHAFS